MRQYHGHRVLGEVVPILQHRAYGRQMVSLWCCKHEKLSEP